MNRQLFSDTGITNKVITLPMPMQKIEVVNRSVNDVTIEINGLVTKITPKDYAFESGYNDFSMVTIVASGEWELKAGY